ncbi:hypothetical protein ABPG74_014027 [Tetrahymena malaccensis]
MSYNCLKHKSKAILFCIDDKCSKQSRYICSKCELSNEHDNHQIEMIEEIPKKVNRCVFQDYPKEKLISSTKELIKQIQQRLNNLLQRYEEQMCLLIKDECSKVENQLQKGKKMLQANFSELSIEDQELFIDLVNNRIGFDQISQNVRNRQMQLEQSISQIQSTLQERLTLQTFKKIKAFEIQLETVYNIQEKSFCMLNEDEVVVGEEDGSLRLINLEQNKQIASIELKRVVSNFSLEKISSFQVVAYEKYSEFLEIVDFNALQGKNIILLKNKGLISCIKPVVFGEIISIGYSNGQLKVYNYKEKSFVSKIDCNIDNINVDMSIQCIDILNDLIAVGGKSGFVMIWNWKSGQLVKTLKKAFSNNDLSSKVNIHEVNKGRSIRRILFINTNEILTQGEETNSFQFYSLNVENQQQYPLSYINVIRFLQPQDYQSIIVKKPQYELPLDFETFQNEYSRNNIVFIQKDFRKSGQSLQIYCHSTNKIKAQYYLERSSQIVAVYLTSKHLIVIYQDGVIEAYV